MTEGNSKRVILEILLHVCVKEVTKTGWEALPALSVSLTWMLGTPEVELSVKGERKSWFTCPLVVPAVIAGLAPTRDVAIGVPS
jgi:hypothetical protein